MKHGTGEIQFDCGKSVSTSNSKGSLTAKEGDVSRIGFQPIQNAPQGTLARFSSTQLVMIFILTMWTKWLIVQCSDNAVLFLLHVSTRKSRTPQRYIYISLYHYIIISLYHYIIISLYHYIIIRSMKHNSTSSQQKCPQDSHGFPTSFFFSTSKAASCSMTWNRPRPSPWKNSMGKHDGRSTDFFWKYWGNNQH